MAGVFLPLAPRSFICIREARPCALQQSTFMPALKPALKYALTIVSQRRPGWEWAVHYLDEIFAALQVRCRVGLQGRRPVEASCACESHCFSNGYGHVCCLGAECRSLSRTLALPLALCVRCVCDVCACDCVRACDRDCLRAVRVRACGNISFLRSDISFKSMMHPSLRTSLRCCAFRARAQAWQAVQAHMLPRSQNAFHGSQRAPLLGSRRAG